MSSSSSSSTPVSSFCGGRARMLEHTVECLEANTWKTPLYVSGAGWNQDEQHHAVAVQLLETLAVNKSCSTLIFQNATLNETMSSAFTQALSQNQDLRSITLRHLTTAAPQEHPDAAAAAPLYQLSAPVFENHPQLESLNLIQVQLDNTACLELAQLLRESSTLTTLSLDAVHINTAGFLPLLAAMVLSPSLQTLRLSNMSSSWTSSNELTRLFRALSFNRTLTHLSVEGMHVSRECAWHVARMLRKNKSLVQLSLRKTGLTAESVPILVQQGLQHNTTLQTLYLSRNHIGTAGAASLAEYLPTTGSLKTLCLVDTGLDSQACLAIIQALRFNTNMRSISLDGNVVWDHSEQMLSMLETSNVTLTNVLDRLPALLAKKSSGTAAVWNQVEFYLRANQSGRRFLQINEDDKDNSKLLPRILSKASTSDVLFYFLRESGPTRLRPVSSESATPRTFVPSSCSTTSVQQLLPKTPLVARQRKMFAAGA